MPDLVEHIFGPRFLALPSSERGVASAAENAEVFLAYIELEKREAALATQSLIARGLNRIAGTSTLAQPGSDRAHVAEVSMNGLTVLPPPGRGGSSSALPARSANKAETNAGVLEKIMLVNSMIKSHLKGIFGCDFVMNGGGQGYRIYGARVPLHSLSKGTTVKLTAQIALDGNVSIVTGNGGLEYSVKMTAELILRILDGHAVSAGEPGIYKKIAARSNQPSAPLLDYYQEPAEVDVATAIVPSAFVVQPRVDDVTKAVARPNIDANGKVILPKSRTAVSKAVAKEAKMEEQPTPDSEAKEKVDRAKNYLFHVFGIKFLRGDDYTEIEQDSKGKDVTRKYVNYTSERQQGLEQENIPGSAKRTLGMGAITVEDGVVTVKISVQREKEWLCMEPSDLLNLPSHKDKVDAHILGRSNRIHPDESKGIKNHSIAGRESIMAKWRNAGHMSRDEQNARIA